MSEGSLIKSSDTIVFLGDSITQPATGYVGMAEWMIGGIDPGMRLKIVNSGIGGHKVRDMLARVGEDVIAHDPDWVCISVGINDVWHGLNGTPIDVFRDAYTQMVERLEKQTAAKLALFTTTVIGEDLCNETNRELIPYNDHIRRVAGEHKHLLVPMNEEFHKAITAWRKAGGEDLRFTIDGVHPTPVGSALMALTLLRTWGLVG